MRSNIEGGRSSISRGEEPKAPGGLPPAAVQPEKRIGGKLVERLTARVRLEPPSPVHIGLGRSGGVVPKPKGVSEVIQDLDPQSSGRGHRATVDSPLRTFNIGSLCYATGRLQRSEWVSWRAGCGPPRWRAPGTGELEILEHTSGLGGEAT